jgi:hypothetical protein
MTNQLLWALTQLVAGVAVLWGAWILLNGNLSGFVTLLVISIFLAVVYRQWRARRSK